MLCCPAPFVFAAAAVLLLLLSCLRHCLLAAAAAGVDGHVSRFSKGAGWQGAQNRLAVFLVFAIAASAALV